MVDKQGADESLRELALFAGAGGGILGGQLLGWRTVCAVELDAYAASILVARQNDGLLPPFPIWDDICTFDGKPWRGIVDVVAGGFPCQDISAAGKGAGITGERSGLWSHMARIVGEVRPRYVFVENSPRLLVRGLGVVLGDMAKLGYDCRWTVLGAADVGAPHLRKRIWILAHANNMRELQQQGRECEQWGRAGDGSQELADADSTGLAQRQCQPSHARQEFTAAERASWWLTESDVGRGFDGLAPQLDATKGQILGPWGDGWEEGVPRVASGVTARVDRLKAIGNGQVPICAAEAWRRLNADIMFPVAP